MGFPDRIVMGRTQDDHAFQGGLNLDARGKAFEQINASNLLQLLAQLIDARRFAQEIFTELAEETEKTSKRIKKVSERVKDVADVVPGIQSIFHATSPECFLVPSSIKLERNTNIRGGIFIRRSAPQKVDRRRAEALDPPNLNALNKFSKALDLTNLKKMDPTLDETNLRCGDKYSLPQFFFQQWLKQESEKHAIREKIRKQRRKERKEARKKKREEREAKKGSKIGRVRKRYVDQFGNIYFKEIGPDIKVAERHGVRRAKDLQVTSHNYGERKQVGNYSEQQNNSAGSYELGKVQPKAEPTLQRPEEFVQPMVPPPVNITNPNHVHVAMPTTAPPPPNPHVNMHQPQPHVPPPVPNTGGRGAPPPTFQPPPTPAQPAAPAMPEHMTPYVKMKKIGLGEWQIKGKMKTNGHDPADYDLYLGDGGGSGAPPPAPAPRGPPSAPTVGGHRAPPSQPARRPAPMMGLLGDIRAGTRLKKKSEQAPRAAPAPATGMGGLMAAIRGGAKLKKPKDRATLPPKELTGQDALLAAIRGKKELKKASARQLKEKTPEPETGDIFALLKLREKIAQSDDEDDDSGSWEDDSF